VCNEFEGLDTYRGYHNAFARVLKPDPLGRVLMLGTDQRDLFVPLLSYRPKERIAPESTVRIDASPSHVPAISIAPASTYVSGDEPAASDLGADSPAHPAIAIAEHKAAAAPAIGRNRIISAPNPIPRRPIPRRNHAA
jgi:hypothetical protein